jgi:hypothetical protein
MNLARGTTRTIASGLAAALILMATAAALAGPPRNRLIGTWRGAVDWFVTDPRTGPAVVTLEFRADGTERTTVAIGKEKVVHMGTYTLKGAKLHIDSKSDGPSDCTVRVSGRKLLIRWAGQPKAETFRRVRN